MVAATGFQGIGRGSERWQTRHQYSAGGAFPVANSTQLGGSYRSSFSPSTGASEFWIGANFALTPVFASDTPVPYSFAALDDWVNYPQPGY